MNSRQKQHGCRERERERAIFYQKRKEAILFNQFSLWRKEGVLSTLRDRSMNYVGYFIDAEGNKYYPEQIDTGWIEANLSNNFKVYNNDSKFTPRFKKIAGKIVEVEGEVSPKQTIAGSTTIYEIFTLPERF